MYRENLRKEEISLRKVDLDAGLEILTLILRQYPRMRATQKITAIFRLHRT